MFSKECNMLISQLRETNDELSLSLLQHEGYPHLYKNTNKALGQCLYNSLKKLIEIADKARWHLDEEDWCEWISEAKQELT